MSAISSIKSLEENHGVYRGKDCMKKFCEYPRECSMEFINFKTKKRRLWTKEQQESYENAKLCYISKEKFEHKYAKDNKYRKFRDHCHSTEEYKGAVHSICNLKYNFSQWI